MRVKLQTKQEMRRRVHQPIPDQSEMAELGPSSVPQHRRQREGDNGVHQVMLRGQPRILCAEMVIGRAP